MQRAIFSKKHYELFAKEIATEPQYEFPMSRKDLIQFVSAIFECDNSAFKAEQFNIACERKTRI